jgi:hypothetical protein
MLFQLCMPTLCIVKTDFAILSLYGEQLSVGNFNRPELSFIIDLASQNLGSNFH